MHDPNAFRNQLYNVPGSYKLGARHSESAKIGTKNLFAYFSVPDFTPLDSGVVLTAARVWYYMLG